MDTPESEAGLLAGCHRGEPEAQRQVYERYRDRVYSIALHFLRGDEAAAGDVTQQSFIKAFRAAPGFRREARLGTWLYRIVANTCLDELRRRRRFRLFGDLPDHLHPASHTPDPDDQPEVLAAVGRLSPPLRLTVLLRYYDDLSYAEIAEALDCTPGTVASRLNRAHAILALGAGPPQAPATGAQGVARCLTTPTPPRWSAGVGRLPLARAPERLWEGIRQQLDRDAPAPLPLLRRPVRSPWLVAAALLLAVGLGLVAGLLRQYAAPDRWQVLAVVGSPGPPGRSSGPPTRSRRETGWPPTRSPGRCSGGPDRRGRDRARQPRAH